MRSIQYTAAASVTRMPPPRHTVHKFRLNAPGRSPDSRAWIAKAGRRNKKNTVHSPVWQADRVCRTGRARVACARLRPARGPNGRSRRPARSTMARSRPGHSMRGGSSISAGPTGRAAGDDGSKDRSRRRSTTARHGSRPPRGGSRHAQRGSTTAQHGNRLVRHGSRPAGSSRVRRPEAGPTTRTPGRHERPTTPPWPPRPPTAGSRASSRGGLLVRKKGEPRNWGNMQNMRRLLAIVSTVQLRTVKRGSLFSRSAG